MTLCLVHLTAHVPMTVTKEKHAKVFIRKCFTQASARLKNKKQNKREREREEKISLTMLLCGLNLTKGIKISIVLLLRGLAAAQQKQGVSSHARMLGDFLVLVFQDSGQDILTDNDLC